MKYSLESQSVSSLFRNTLSSNGKTLIINFFQHFIYFSEGSCEHITNGHSTVTMKWFRNDAFKNKLTRDYPYSKQVNPRASFFSRGR